MTEGERAFAEAIRRLRQSGFGPEAFERYSDADVEALEERLKVRLPPSYKALVRGFGSLQFEGTEIYGLTPSGHEAAGPPMSAG